MMKQIVFVIVLLVVAKIGNGQTPLLVNEEGWEINHYQGSCYHDTIIHAVFLYIDPSQQLKKYQNDSSFVVVEVIVVNKSPIDIYVYGKNDRMRVPVIKEKYVPDTAVLRKSNNYLWSAMPMKLHRSSAFEQEDYLKNPHKDLWSRENRNSLIEIPKGERKTLIVVIPKREGDYRVEAIVEFNRDMYAYDCEGHRVSWQHFRTIESNKIELKMKK